MFLPTFVRTASPLNLCPPVSAGSYVKNLWIPLGKLTFSCFSQTSLAILAGVVHMSCDKNSHPTIHFPNWTYTKQLWIFNQACACKDLWMWWRTRPMTCIWKISFEGTTFSRLEFPNSSREIRSGEGDGFLGFLYLIFTFSFFNIWETLPEMNSASCEPTIKRFPKKDEQLKTWSFSAKAKMKRNWSTRPPLDQEWRRIGLTCIL
jgi:hypothetical protein